MKAKQNWVIAKVEVAEMFTLAAKIELDAKGNVPEWIQLFPAGWVTLADGPKYLVDEEAYRLVTEYVAARGIEVVFDYEHQSLETDEAPASGWIKELKWDETDGIMARVEWTERGREYLEKREYRYHSPVFLVREKDRRLCGLHSAALTNTPRTNNLRPIAAKQGLIGPDEENDMELAILIAKLGLAEGATEDDVLAKIGELVAGPAEVEVVAKDVIEVLGLEDGATVSSVVASINVLKQAPEGMVPVAEFNKLKDQVHQGVVTDVVAKAIATGKVTPDQKDWATKYATKDLDGFNEYVAKAPQVVPISKLPGKQDAGGDAKLNETDLHVASMMGVEKEDIEKYCG